MAIVFSRPVLRRIIEMSIAFPEKVQHTVPTFLPQQGSKKSSPQTVSGSDCDWVTKQGEQMASFEPQQAI